MGVLSAEPVESPQHLFQIIGYVHYVVDRIADHGFPRNLSRIGDAIIAEARKSRADVSIFNPIFERWPLVAVIGVAKRRVMIAHGKLIQPPRK